MTHEYTTNASGQNTAITLPVSMRDSNYDVKVLQARISGGWGNANTVYHLLETTPSILTVGTAVTNAQVVRVNWSVAGYSSFTPTSTPSGPPFAPASP